MKIALLTLGTRGDTQPFIALGKALQAQGHDVVLGAPENFQSWVESHALVYRSIGVDMQAFVESRDARKVMGGNPFAMIRLWRRTILPLTRSSLDAIWEAARDADVIVYHPKTAGAEDVGEATGAVLVYAAPLPVFPSRAFPLFVLPGSYGPWLNLLSYRLLLFSQALLTPTVNRWRMNVLGLGKRSARPRDRRQPLQLCAVSRSVLPGYPAQRSENIETTGYWFLDEDPHWHPDAALAAFLDSGDRPVYIGFGSVTTLEPGRLARIIVDGVRRSGLRAILATGWGAMAEVEVPANVHVIERAPHGALFKLVSAVVHHGGAGTTAAGLRAGRPTLICPLSVDQPFWGRRVFSLGCGPRPLPLKRLSAERFAQALIQLTHTDAYQRRAGETASAIARENGVSRAVEIIETAGNRACTGC